MGTEFDVRIWFDEPGTPQDRLVSVLRALDGHDTDWGPMGPVQAERPGRSERVIGSVGPTPSDLAAEVESTVAAESGPELLSTGLVWPVWRFDRGTPFRDSVHLAIEAWTQDWPFRPIPALDGHVSLWAPSAPFAATGSRGREATARAEDNVEALVALLTTLLTSLGPAKLAVFNGNGMHHSLNANALWLATNEAWLDELTLLQTLWDEGCQDWKLGPLADETAARSAWSLHESRTVEERAAIWSRLDGGLARRTIVEPAHVESVLADDPFGVFGQGESRLLLDLPDLFNTFVGEVLLDLVEAPSS